MDGLWMISSDVVAFVFTLLLRAAANDETERIIASSVVEEALQRYLGQHHRYSVAEYQKHRLIIWKQALAMVDPVAFRQLVWLFSRKNCRITLGEFSVVIDCF
jgi:hypothetical protein